MRVTGQGLRVRVKVRVRFGALVRRVTRPVGVGFSKGQGLEWRRGRVGVRLRLRLRLRLGIAPVGGLTCCSVRVEG